MIQNDTFFKAFAGGNEDKALKLKVVEKVFIREARGGRAQQNQGKAKIKTRKHQKLVLKQKRRKTKKTDKGSEKYRQTDTCESGVTTQCMEVIAFNSSNNFIDNFRMQGMFYFLKHIRETIS